MEPIILLGGGGHCISCIDIIEQTGKYEILGILDLPEKVGQKILNYNIIGTDQEINYFLKECQNFVITAGQITTTSTRIKIYNLITKAGGRLPAIISPTAKVSRYSTVQDGTIIMHHALVNAAAKVGICGILNSKALVEHEARIGNFCHISTGSIVNGQVNIGDRCFIGSNTVIANNIDIVSETVIAAGSQVLKSIHIAGTYIGSPLRKIN
ncbi:MAG: NeuD/PglB/VioB family sugar acetyltransferase [Chlorobium sp.]|jgi:sugar O-acyltransferase (sialic acid O-acetyltransferase NeuD family)|nr:NeuD/PglB/VioB family sugar acetyltransferase [Chlorobium sp.]